MDNTFEDVVAVAVERTIVNPLELAAPHRVVSEFFITYLPKLETTMTRAVVLLLLLTLTLAASARRQPACKRPSRLSRGSKVPVPSHCFGGKIVIANRAGRSITLINPDTLESNNVKLPVGAEPMYFGLNNAKSEIWVGDRGNSKLQILRLVGNSIKRVGFVRTPAGVFHSIFTQDLSVPHPIVWTTCDVAKVTVVHDLTTRRKLAEIPLPPKVAALNGVPHDVTANKDYGFITYIGNSDGAGYVASYDATTFKLIKLIRVADDPHVAIRGNTKLAIAAQGGQVLLASIPDLKILRKDKRQPSPHGTIITFNLKYLYVTNIAEMGEKALVTYDISRLERQSCPDITTSNPTPHNPATTLDGKKVFITHSGAKSDIVSVFDIGGDGCPIPNSEKIIKTGLNPFGLVVLPPAVRHRRCPKC